MSHPVTPRRTYLIGRARPNAIVGRNREDRWDRADRRGRVPRHDVQAPRPRPDPAHRAARRLPHARAGGRLRAVQAPHVLQVVRDQPQLQADAPQRHHLPLRRHRGRHPARRAGDRGRPAARHRPHHLAGGALRAGRDRRTAARGPQDGDGRDRDRGPRRRPARLRGPGGPRRPLRHPAQARGQRRRLRHPHPDARPHPPGRPRRARQGRRPARRRQGAAVAAAVVRPAPVHGVHQQRTAPRLPHRLHALQPRTGRRGPRDGPRRPPAERAQAGPGRGTGGRHGARADRHLFAPPGSRHPRTPATGAGAGSPP